MSNFVVTTLVDENDGGAGGTGLSLREALALANSDPTTADTITFNAALAGQTIHLGGTELAITGDVTIEGDIDGDGDADITVSGQLSSRVFNIDDGGATTISATLDGLLIENGRVIGADGGGIRVGAADALTLTNSSVVSNRSEGPSGRGGGIFGDAGAAITLTNSTVAANRAGDEGGGIFSDGGTVTLTNSTLSANRAGDGGGMFIDGGTATLLNTTLAGNDASFDGGGIFSNGTVKLTNSTLSGNYADSDGGGIFNDAAGTATLTNTTVSGNVAVGQGGGILNNGGILTLANSIAAGNDAGTAGDIQPLGGTLNLAGGNIVGDMLTVDGVAQPGAIALTDIFASVTTNPVTGALSGELADNGGPVMTIALNPNPANPALDAADPDALDEVQAGADLNGDGDTTDVIDADARGFDRGAGVSVDLGAFEQQAAESFVVTTLADQAFDGGDLTGETLDGGGLSLREALALANQDPTAADTITFDAALSGGSAPGVDDGVITLGGSALSIVTDLTVDGDIDGDGDADITVSGNDMSRVFTIQNGFNPTAITVALNGLVIRDGNAAYGGGISVSVAALTLTNSTVTANAAGSGGGLWNGSSSTVTLTNTMLSDNEALNGGAISNNGNATLANTTLSGNQANFAGGGIANAGTATLTNVTLSGNEAAVHGGGIYNVGAATLTNTTLSGNGAYNGNGGGIFNNGTAGLANSIVAGNFAGIDGDDIQGTLILTGGNIIGATLTLDGIGQAGVIELTDVFASVTNDPNTGVLSGQLSANGGPVQTIALDRGAANPARDAGDPDALDEAQASKDLNGDGDMDDVIAADARGFARDVDGVDLGAFEQQDDASFIVTTLDDGVDNDFGGGNLAAEMLDGGGLSLREALALANGDPTTADTITFHDSLSGDTLTLGGTELAIATNVTIDGDIDGDGHADITVSGNDASRVFNIDGAGAITASLNGLVVRDGFVSTGSSGAGIRIAGGDALILTNSTVMENVASGSAAGGGILNNGTATLINAILSGNQSHGGGAIFNAGTLDITNSTLSDNQASYQGGAIFNSYLSEVTLTNTTVSGNVADYGGGIFNSIGSVTLTNTTVAGNAADHGGGIFNSGGASTPATLTLTNSTVSGNLANFDGGGIQNHDSTSTTTLVNTIVAGNDALGAGDDVQSNGTLALSGGNIVGDTFTIDGGSPQAGIALTAIFAAIDPGTGGGQLAHNGGSIETIALNRNAANPALDAGDPDALDEVQTGTDLNGDGDTDDVITTDARGFERDVSGVDLGAFEQQDDASFIVTTLDDGVDNDFGGGNLADETADGGGLSLREALALANGDPTTADTITFHASLDDGTLTLQSGELLITSDVTIDGDIGGDGTGDITIDAAGASRVLNVISGTSSLNGLTITGGDVTCGCFGDYGGGISVGSLFYGTTADLTISNSTIRNNAAVYGGGIAVDFGSTVRLVNAAVTDNSADYVGGGIANHGELTVVNSNVSRNSAGYIGGGIANDGTLAVVNSTLSDNRSDVVSGGIAPNAGGGLYNAGTAALTSVTISGNAGGYAGGGVYNNGNLTLTNATIANNTAVYGGGLYNADCGCGDVTIDSSTFSGNFAGGIGGGIYNAAGTVALANSIVAGNGAGNSDPDIVTDIGSAATTFGGVNVFSQAGAGDADDIIEANLASIFATLTTIDPDGVAANGDEFFAGKFQNNGGPVHTIAILPGGVAYDAGDTDALPPDTADLDGDIDDTEDLPVDARGPGFTRVNGAAVDIGAFEEQNTAPVQSSNTGLGVNEGGHATITSAELDYTDGQQNAANVIFTITAAAAIGTLFLGATALGLNDTFTQQDIADGRLSYTHDGSETSLASFGFEVSDGVGGTTTGQSFAINISAVNDAPVNSVPPGTQQIEANVATAIAGLSIADADAGLSSLTTTLAVAHGTLMVAAIGGAGVSGSGTSSVTITGTLAQINATLGAAGNVVYQGALDQFGPDTLHVVTHDNGHTGIGGPLSDSDDIAINLNTWLIGTPGPDRFTALPGNERIDALTGIDTLTLNFKLTDAIVTYRGNEVIIDGPGGSHTVTTGFEVFNFTDGTVHNDDGNPLVDDLFYYSRNHDVWNAHFDAEYHYAGWGWQERRDPNAFFSTRIYLGIDQDVKAANVNPLDHWHMSGWQEGRLPSLAFDAAKYLAANPDVAAAHIDPLAHFLEIGASEGRQPIAPSHLLAANGFDYVYYLQQNPDVVQAEADPFLHFQTTGWKEGRDPNAFFDVGGYLANYTDVKAAGINPLDHYNIAGWKEGRDPSVDFDTNSYLATYTDVKAAQINPLTHFLQSGIEENRSAFADGVWG
jgi:hypothetical protein